MGSNITSQQQPASVVLAHPMNLSPRSGAGSYGTGIGPGRVLHGVLAGAPRSNGGRVWRVRGLVRFPVQAECS